MATLYSERSVAGKITFALLGPVLAGVGSAILLGTSWPLFLLATAAGLSAAFVGGREHRDLEAGIVRGLAGGFAFGASLVLTHLALGNEDKVGLPDPVWMFVVFTTFGSMPIGAAGALHRSLEERPANEHSRDLSLFKAGLVAALVATPLGVLTQVLHPLPDPRDDNPTAFLETIAPSDQWVLIHLLGLLSFLLMPPILAALWLSYSGHRSRCLAAYAFLFGSVAVTVSLVWMVLDGIAIKDLGDAWARSGGAERLDYERVGISLEELILALFSLELVLLFGVVYVLLGLAALGGSNDPRWLSATVVAAGAYNVVIGVIQAYTDRTLVVTHILVPIGVVYVSAWLPVATLLMWRRVKDEAVETAGAAHVEEQVPREPLLS